MQSFIKEYTSRTIAHYTRQLLQINSSHSRSLNKHDLSSEHSYSKASMFRKRTTNYIKLKGLKKLQATNRDPIESYLIRSLYKYKYETGIEFTKCMLCSPGMQFICACSVAQKNKFIPCNVRVPNQENSNYMMRHHYRKILPSGLPCKECSNTIGVESTLAHIEKHY